MAVLRSTPVRLAVTLAILALLASRIDMREAGRAMLSLDLRLGAAVLFLIALDRCVMVLRWALLVRASDAPVPFRSAAWIYLVSSFVGSFLPAGVGADAVRAWSLTQRTSAGSEAVASVAVDRLLGLLSLVLLGGLGVLVWTRLVEPELRQAVLALGLLGAAATAGVFWADHALRAALPRQWQRSGIGSHALRLLDALGRYRGRRRTLTTVLVLSIGVQLLRIWQAYLLGLGIGIQVELAYYLVFMPIGLVMLLLPVSIGGFGLPQGVMVWLLAPQGVPAPDAFALSTLIVLSGTVGNLPGAWLYLRAPRA